MHSSERKTKSQLPTKKKSKDIVTVEEINEDETGDTDSDAEDETQKHKQQKLREKSKRYFHHFQQWKL